jgi:NAD(P)-dependent dehydrogenase (short-subunit alcohol dehydrogenase family)
MSGPQRTDKPLAWVAGGSRGLGFALARELGRRGHRVLITARTQSDLDRAQSDLVADGIEVVTCVHDVRDAEGARRLVSDVEAEHGPIETVFAVAGVLKVGPLPERAEDYEESIDIMLRGPINVVHAVLPGMRERGRGRIGIVTSIAGLFPVPHLVPYSAAKHGAVGFANGLAEELQGTPISVSTIIPGLMRTGGHWHADYRGQPGREYIWFAGLSAAPLVSMNADRATKIIVGGVLRGRRKIIYTIPARVGDVLYRLSPVAVGAAIGWAGRLLPDPEKDTQDQDHSIDHPNQSGYREAPGYRAVRRTPKIFDRLTVLADRAVRRLNQSDAHQS